MIEKLLNLYKDKFRFENFYNNLLYSISKDSKTYISHPTFLSNYSNIYKPNTTSVIQVKKDDVRIDLPVWFSNSTSEKRIVVLGLEPRHTNDIYNIERIDNQVFATPFAVERWVRGKYFNAFQDLINEKSSFVYFTDVVKDYEIKSIHDKKLNDLFARQNFNSKAAKYELLLSKELEIIDPVLILALGKPTYSILNKFLKNKYRLEKITHPAAWGGANKAREEINKLINA